MKKSIYSLCGTGEEVASRNFPTETSTLERVNDTYWLELIYQST